MYFTDTAESDELRKLVTRFHAAHPTPFPARPGDELGPSEARWAELAEMGAIAPQIDDALGGAGLSFEAFAVTAEAGGAEVSDLPLLASAGAAELLARCGDTAAHLLGDIATGRRSALALDAHTPLGAVSQAGVHAQRDGASWRLHGVKHLVRADASTSLVLVLADTDDGPGLFGLDLADVTQTPVPTLDPTVPLSRLDVTGAPGTLLAHGASVDAIVEDTLDRIWIGAAAELLGVAQAALDLAVSVVTTREQFGRPVGANQAVKHRLADTYADVASLRSAVTYAAHRSDLPGAETEVRSLAPLVLSLAMDVSLHSANDAVQFSGAMGYTWEHPAHRYLKRAATAPALFGSPESHREAMLTRRGW